MSSLDTAAIAEAELEDVSKISPIWRSIRVLAPVGVVPRAGL